MVNMENKDLELLLKEMEKTIPSYYYEVPASSTGKYHPAYALGKGGLHRHTQALLKIMEHIFTIDFSFDSRERDLMRIAGIMHDSRKSGSQEDYEKDPMTKFEHPILAANEVRNFKGKSWNDNEIEIIAQAVESHMGQWNTRIGSECILPLPTNKYQKLLHMCDYLASRKDIIVDGLL